MRAAAIRKHRKMDTSSACTTSTEPPHSLCPAQRLKIFLKEKELPVSGRKSELVRRFADFQEVEALQAELGAVSCSRTSVYQHCYLSRVFQQVAGVSRACGWSVGDLSQVTDRCTTLAAAYTLYPQLNCHYSAPDSLNRLTEAYCDAMAGGSLLVVAF